jgi:hypothetical protein
MNRASLLPHEKVRMLSQPLQQRDVFDFTRLAEQAERSGWSTVAWWIRHQCNRPRLDPHGSGPIPPAVPPITLDVAPFQVYHSDRYLDRVEVLHLLEAAYPLPPIFAQPMAGIVL